MQTGKGTTMNIEVIRKISAAAAAAEAVANAMIAHQAQG